MRPLRSLRNRLALIFALIVLAAIGGLYVYVTPPLQERLIAQKLDDLTQDARRWAPRIARVAGTSASQKDLDRRVQSAAAQTSSEVTLLGLVAGSRDAFLVFSDSNPGGAGLGDMQSVARQARRDASAGVGDRAEPRRPPGARRGPDRARSRPLRGRARRHADRRAGHGRGRPQAHPARRAPSCC